jgi:uncharacterized phiE125 gp8 family phage protein
VGVGSYWCHGREIGCTWSRVTAPTSEPITVEEAKAQARITDTASDVLIDVYIAAAREAAEEYMGRGLLTQKWQLLLDGFANIMPLPMASPLQNDSGATPSTAVVVQYYDAAGAQQTLSTTYYDVDTVSRPGRVVLKPDQSWPTVQSGRRNGAVTITYYVGWTSADLVPERIKQGLRQYVAYLDLDRAGIEASAVQAKDAAERCWSDRILWSHPQYGY